MTDRITLPALPRRGGRVVVTRLGEEGVRLHIVRDAIIQYRDAAHLTLEAADRALWQLAREARDVERTLIPETWWTPDPEHGLVLTLRVLRYRTQAVVLVVSALPEDAPRLGDAEAVAAVVERYMEQRRIAERQARAELHAAQWCATAVDATVSPEQWRYRSALTGDDCTLRIQRTGDGPPLIVAADWRPHRR